MNIDAIITRIEKVNPGRSIDSVPRRVCKTYEEFGEFTQAFLNFSSPTNPKNKTLEDVLEELVDVSIMVFDIYLTYTNIKVVTNDFNNGCHGDDKAIKYLTIEEIIVLLGKEIDSVLAFTDFFNIWSYIIVDYYKIPEPKIEAMFDKKVTKWENQVLSKTTIT